MSETTPPRPQDILVYAMKTTRWLMESLCKDLSPAELLHRACDKGNCAAWILGHLINTDHRMLQSLTGDAPPLPEGFKERFATKGDAPQAKDFGDVSGLLQLFLNTRDALIAATERTDTAQLSAPVDIPNPRFSTRWQFLTLCGFHTGTHAGQISTIRRSLGRPPLF
jgi:uncharacterized damage-inducible protein DinB